MLLLVPLSFGFTYMMIKLAKNAEANAKLQPKKAGGKTAINLPKKWIYILFIVLLAFQVYLNISAYYAVLNGMKNFSLFIIGIIMLVFAGMFHIYRHGTAMAKAPPPRPTTLPSPAKPMPSAPKPMPSIPKPSAEPLPAPPIQKASGTQVATQTSRTTTSTTTTTIPASTSAPSDSKTENTKNDLAGRSTVQASKKLVDT
jgi:ubiquinol-cytochrome c reductase cytochrome b subunit